MTGNKGPCLVFRDISFSSFPRQQRHTPSNSETKNDKMIEKDFILENFSLKQCEFLAPSLRCLLWVQFFLRTSKTQFETGTSQVCHEIRQKDSRSGVRQTHPSTKYFLQKLESKSLSSSQDQQPSRLCKVCPISLPLPSGHPVSCCTNREGLSGLLFEYRFDAGLSEFQCSEHQRSD